MNESLTPKELARVKRQARTRRISNIRRRVMLLGATLAAVFSGVVLMRTEVNQPAAGSSTQPALVRQAPVQPEGESDVGESDEGQSDEIDSGEIPTTAPPTTAPPVSTPAPVPQPAAPLTTSQS